MDPKPRSAESCVRSRLGTRRKWRRRSTKLVNSSVVQLLRREGNPIAESTIPSSTFTSSMSSQRFTNLTRIHLPHHDLSRLYKIDSIPLPLLSEHANRSSICVEQLSVSRESLFLSLQTIEETRLPSHSSYSALLPTKLRKPKSVSCGSKPQRSLARLVIRRQLIVRSCKLEIVQPISLSTKVRSFSKLEDKRTKRFKSLTTNSNRYSRGLTATILTVP